jgi:EAL domain-containing protein (putative c-di-GMP-specific phosphodiesterase class I)
VGAFGVNINVSVRQIEHDGFLHMVEECLRRNHLAPGTVTVEITESLIMRDFDRAVERLNELKSRGVRIAIDDFGTGYSSLRYLKSLPVDELKIDKTFIDDVAEGPEPGAVALAVIKLARTFGLATLAEGVEKEAQVTALRKMGADLGQGFLFARPMDAPTMEAFLARKFG